MKKVSAKEVLTSNGNKWISKTYANRIRREEGLKPLQELNCYH